MANVMAILQEVDKCMRCNGCVISCKRTWKMKALNYGVHKVAADQRVVIKSQKAVDNAPFVRYSCWHCMYPPCASRCPFKAIKKEASGAVSIDHTKCNPDSSLCKKQCTTDCMRGGYPKVGVGSDLYLTKKSFKCTMCHGRAGLGGDLPTKAAPAEYAVGAVEEKEHQPSCVYTCPARAMVYDTRAAIMARLGNPAEGWASYRGDGNMWWASKKYLIAAPKADPFVEDHLSPMVGSLLNSPFAKAALVPTLVAGGLLALSARRASIAEESTMATSGEVL
jgi:Fe-S-cluster-containing dehydrogenase component